jgi:hypothetical protein
MKEGKFYPKFTNFETPPLDPVINDPILAGCSPPPPPVAPPSPAAAAHAIKEKLSKPKVAPKPNEENSDVFLIKYTIFVHGQDSVVKLRMPGDKSIKHLVRTYCSYKNIANPDSLIFR